MRIGSKASEHVYWMHGSEAGVMTRMSTSTHTISATKI